MTDLQFSGATEKLNNHNYSTWRTSMESYLQGQDLWENVGGSDTTPPPIENVGLESGVSKLEKLCSQS